VKTEGSHQEGRLKNSNTIIKIITHFRKKYKSSYFFFALLDY